jgi:hypothetical protein
VLSNPELTLAPWNATRFPYGQAVTWHFHGLRILKRTPKSYEVDFGPYPLPSVARENVYLPYIDDLSRAIRVIINAGGTVNAQAQYSLKSQIKSFLSNTIKQKWRFNFSRTIKL